MYLGPTRTESGSSEALLTFEDAFHIALAMQDTENTHDFFLFVYQVINPDRLESQNRPGAESLKVRLRE
jgi:hypothetical protein